MTDELLYTIQQVSQITGLSVHTLRYYESVGLLDGVARAGNQHRRYHERDVLWIKFLIRLRETGMPIRQMQQYAEYVRQGDASLAERKAILIEHQEAVLAHIAQLQQHLAFITTKIENYERIQQSFQHQLNGTTTQKE